MQRLPLKAMLLAVVLAAGCQKQEATAVPAPARQQQSTVVPTSPQKEPAMIIKRSGDRLPPPEVAPVERDGIRYSQATDGRRVGANQVGGVLVATDVASGKQLWTLAVYGNPVNPDREADTQWRFFTSMAFDPDGRLRIVNEADKTFFVDVKARTTSPAG